MVKDILSYGLGTSGQSVALNMLYPYPEPKVKTKVA
jgi:hypothetical protein